MSVDDETIEKVIPIFERIPAFRWTYQCDEKTRYRCSERLLTRLANGTEVQFTRIWSTIMQGLGARITCTVIIDGEDCCTSVYHQLLSRNCQSSHITEIPPLCSLFDRMSHAFREGYDREQQRKEAEAKRVEEAKRTAKESRERTRANDLLGKIRF